MTDTPQWGGPVSVLLGLVAILSSGCCCVGGCCAGLPSLFFTVLAFVFGGVGVMQANTAGESPALAYAGIALAAVSLITQFVGLLLSMFVNGGLNAVLMYLQSM